MFDKRTWTAALAATALLGAAPAAAITNGVPDGEAHPHVGAMLLKSRITGALNPGCTGTLISERVFLTAGHCTDRYASRGTPADEAYVSFDEDARRTNAGRTVHRGTWITDPEYGYRDRGGASDPHELGVIVLDQPITDRAPARLPSAGELAAMQLRDARFVTVGFGSRREDETGGPHSIEPGGTRYRAEQGFLAREPAWLQLSQNPSTGDGGSCYGDSGGPHFLVDTGELVSITVAGDIQCRAIETTYRLDTTSARNFLGRFVTLP